MTSGHLRTTASTERRDSCFFAVMHLIRGSSHCRRESSAGSEKSGRGGQGLFMNASAAASTTVSPLVASPANSKT